MVGVGAGTAAPSADTSPEFLEGEGALSSTETGREAEDRQADAWGKLRSHHWRCQVLGEQIVSHPTETDCDNLPKKQGPLRGSRSLPMCLAQTTAAVHRPGAAAGSA